MTVTQTSWTPTTAATLRIPVQGRAPKPEPTDRSAMLTIPEGRRGLPNLTDVRAASDCRR